MGKVLDININLILLGKWPRISEGIIDLFFGVLCLSNCGLTTCHSAFTNGRHRVFFEWKSRYRKILFEAVFGKEFCTNARMPPGRKAFSFHFYKSFSFTSWILGANFLDF